MKEKPEAIAINRLKEQVKSLEERIKMLEDAILKPKEESKGLADWDNATEDAKYFAVDEIGNGWFYRSKPYINQSNWDSYGDCIVEAGSTKHEVEDWTKTLEKRPTNK